MEVVDGMHVRQSQGGGRMSGDARSSSRVRGDTLMTPPSRCAALRRVELELMCLLEKAPVRCPSVSWLQSIMLYRRIKFCN